MIISKTPLRISFFSGGSDLPAFYKRAEGAALSVTIDKYIYVMAHSKSRGNYVTAFDGINDYDTLDAMTHDITRETLKEYKIKNKVHVASISDIPGKGSGLGSSSSFTVGLINALKECHEPASLAEQACNIEMNRCEYPVGKQDQYAAAIGGLNLFKFSADRVASSLLNISKETITKLQDNLLLVYTGISRSANKILSEQSKSMTDDDKFNLVMNGRNKAIFAADLLERGDLDTFGDLLHQAWLDKKNVASGITSEAIDDIYDVAMLNGALGGKVLGAGGGGFMIFYCESNKKEELSSILGKKTRAVTYDFNFTREGSKVVYADEILS